MAGYNAVGVANDNAAFELWNERWQQMAEGDQTQTDVENTEPPEANHWPTTPPGDANTLPKVPAPELDSNNSLENLVAYAAPDGKGASGDGAVVVQTTEKKMANNEASASDTTETSKLTLDFSKHIPTGEFKKFAEQSGMFIYKPEDPDLSWWANYNLPDVWILNVNTPDGLMKYVFARFIGREGATLSQPAKRYDYVALVSVVHGVNTAGSNLAAAQGIYLAARAKTLRAVDGALTFTMHMIPTGAALDALGAADMGTKKADWQAAGIALAADASLLLGGAGKVWQGTRAGKVMIGTALAIDGAFAIHSGSDTIKFAINREWLKAAGAGGETLLRPYGLRVLSKDLAAKEMRAAVGAVGPPASPLRETLELPGPTTPGRQR